MSQPTPTEVRHDLLVDLPASPTLADLVTFCGTAISLGVPPSADVDWFPPHSRARDQGGPRVRLSWSTPTARTDLTRLGAFIRRLRRRAVRS